MRGVVGVCGGCGGAGAAPGTAARTDTGGAAPGTAGCDATAASYSRNSQSSEPYHASSSSNGRAAENDAAQEPSPYHPCVQDPEPSPIDMENNNDPLGHAAAVYRANSSPLQLPSTMSPDRHGPIPAHVNSSGGEELCVLGAGGSTASASSSERNSSNPETASNHRGGGANNTSTANSSWTDISGGAAGNREGSSKERGNRETQVFAELLRGQSQQKMCPSQDFMEFPWRNNGSRGQWGGGQW